MSWTSFARTDFAANDAGRTARGDYLVERDTLVAGRPFAAEQFAEFSSITLADAADFTIRTPDFAIAGWFLHAVFEVKVAAGTAGQIRLRNVTDSNNGAFDTGISNTSYALSGDMSVQVDAGEHTDVNIKVQVQNADATNLLFVRNTQTGYYYATMWWEPTS